MPQTRFQHYDDLCQAGSGREKNTKNVKKGLKNFLRQREKALGRKYWHFGGAELGQAQLKLGMDFNLIWHERSALGWLIGNDVSGHYKQHYFLFFFFVVYFSHRRSARIKKLIWQKLMAAPNNLGFDLFPNPRLFRI